MIEPLSWEGRDEQRENPFRPGSTRPLKITLHNASLAAPTSQEAEAIGYLRELGQLDEIELYETEPGAENYIHVGDAQSGSDYFEVTVWNRGRPIRHSGVSYVEQQRTTAESVAVRCDPRNPDIESALEAVLVVGAHNALGRDLLVTESKWIYDRHLKFAVQRANPRRLFDALNIVGLFLRSRDQYVYRIKPTSVFDPGKFDRSLFYWVLARHRTPHMWRYYSACVSLGDGHLSAIRRMGASILPRCKRALQARDFIGEAFYAPHGERARDDTNYHFDYLTLLLAGALDAEARIARTLYGITEGPRTVNFRHEKFMKRLKEAGAEELCHLMVEPRVKALLTLLFEVRNTIHEASLASHGYSTSGRGPGLIELQDDGFGNALWHAAESAGGAEAWGLKRQSYQKGVGGPVVEPVRIVPYAYAVSLVRECVDLVDRVAAATDISRMFDDRVVPATLIDAPPEDRVFAAEIRNRIALLG
ncbi:MAG: hypothetical protein HY657_16950 [Acidobacteria bacterium]|nr:hypothetical protein [Acidobacteriota bacterium]